MGIAARVPNCGSNHPETGNPYGYREWKILGVWEVLYFLCCFKLCFLFYIVII
uniref:Uncharacterized protein n=1 Tax=Arundo donax TaxID=35708 RepID=A0A0A8Z6F6_ARUDO